jgi:16S rRNA pseudouridine516 synthase
VKVRLDKFLALAAVAARREIKNIIASGTVSVNGETVLDAGYILDTDTAKVTVNGVQVFVQRPRILMMNKPAGVLSVTRDENRATVMQLLPRQYCDIRFFPIGRLDMDTQGLLLFTNSGALADKILRPEKPIVKRYYARHHGTAQPEDVAAFAAGLVLDGRLHCAPAILEPLGPGESNISVTQGKYHLVRRMMWSRTMRVNYLRRDAIGALELGELESGCVRELDEKEIELIFK